MSKTKNTKAEQAAKAAEDLKAAADAANAAAAQAAEAAELRQLAADELEDGKEVRVVAVHGRYLHLPTNEWYETDTSKKITVDGYTRAQIANGKIELSDA